MVRYNLKTYIKVLVFLSISVFLAFYFLASRKGSVGILELWGCIGKTASLVFVIVFIFEKWLWKCKIFHPWLVPVPNLVGTWRGTIRYFWDGENHEKSIQVKLNQSFFYVLVQIKTDESWSTSVCASFDIDEKKGIRRLIYSYYNVPKISVRDRSQIHYGTACLDICDDFRKLEGNYWTDRKSQGELVFYKV